MLTSIEKIKFGVPVTMAIKTVSKLRGRHWDRVQHSGRGDGSLLQDIWARGLSEGLFTHASGGQCWLSPGVWIPLAVGLSLQGLSVGFLQRGGFPGACSEASGVLQGHFCRILCQKRVPKAGSH